MQRRLFILSLLIACAIVTAAQFDENQLVSDFMPTLIEQVNSREDCSWVASANKFSSWSWARIKRELLLKNYPEHKRNNLVATVSNSLPDHFDARITWPQCAKPVRDQGKCGSCWAVSLAVSFQNMLFKHI